MVGVNMSRDEEHIDSVKAVSCCTGMEATSIRPLSTISYCQNQ